MADIKSVINLPPANQIGIVVKNVDTAMDYYSCIFGLGPFMALELNLEEFTYKGKTGNCRLKVAFAQSGSLQIELIEVLEGETPYTEFLQEKGEGVHHLCFPVDDLSGTLAKLAQEGIEPVLQHSMPEYGTSFAYINSDRVGGVMFELVETKPQ